MKASFIAWLCLRALLHAAAKPPEKLIFTNVNVVNTRDGGIEQGVTVVITKDRITGVGKVGFVAQGRNIQVINANGKYLIAGLWDMHVHSAFVSPGWDERVIYPLYIANGVTGVRDMGGDPDTLEPIDDVANGALVAVAAYFGPTRLIDNVVLPGRSTQGQELSPQRTPRTQS